MRQPVTAQPIEAGPALVLEIGTTLAKLQPMLWLHVLLIAGCSAFGPHNEQDTLINLTLLQQGLIVFAAKHHGNYPLSQAEFRQSMGTAWPTDAWGNSIVYFGSESGYCLLSLGGDERVGGSDELGMDLVVCSDDQHVVANTHADPPPPEAIR